MLRQAGSEPDEQVRVAYRIALSRQPSRQELKLNVAFLRRQQAHHTRRETSDPALAALTDLCHVMFNLNEFVYIN